MRTRHRSFLALALAIVGLALQLAPSAAAQACPNEALRSELGAGSLPDCRAYEQVTPPYKEGFTVGIKSLSSNGEKAIVTSHGDLAGAPGDGESVIQSETYLDQRRPTGWQLSPITGSSSEFAGQLLEGYEANNGDTLWIQHTTAQSEEDRQLWVRSGVTGEFEPIGPLSPHLSEGEPPSNYNNPNENDFARPIASTHDYGHNVLEATEGRNQWSFDETNEENASLYEYSGTHNEQPILVGVEGAKRSEQLLGTCGTELGRGRGGSEYNALSSDGETIFFTLVPKGRFGCEGRAPATAEVYARIDGAINSPGKAETPDVSPNQCTLECGPESGKNFEGASESGLRVYFTSTQKLANDAVDGTASGDAYTEDQGCGITPQGLGGCNLYTYDLTTRRLSTVAAGEVLGVAGIAENGEHAYFVDRSRLTSEPRAGGCLAALAPEVLAEEELTHEGPCRPKQNQFNLYAYNAPTGTTSFVATLGAQDSQDWSRPFTRPVQVAGEEGRFLLFASSTPGLLPDDTTNLAQLFEYDADTGELVRVTQGEAGYAEDGNAIAAGFEPSTIASVNEPLGRTEDRKTTTNLLNISQDGRTVVFVTKARLSPRATSAQLGCKSVYEFRTNGAISEGSVHLLSDGSDVQHFKGVSCGANFPGMDADGANIMVSTEDPLLLSDVDGLEQDVYDVREDGGFPAALAPATCAGGGCEGTVSGPAGVQPTSMSLGGEGNLLAPAPAAPVKPPAKKPVKCAKGKKLVHHKCVKVKPKHKARNAALGHQIAGRRP